MVVDLKAVMDTVEQYVADVKAAFPVHKAYLYGSYATGNPRWDSDVDLCFFLNGRISEGEPAMFRPDRVQGNEPAGRSLEQELVARQSRPSVPGGAAELPIGVTLLGMTRKYDPKICIEPRIFPASELQNDNPFVKEIVRTGHEIVVG
jgi:hypothetical protein